MKRGIVVTTSFYTRDFLKPLLKSIKDTKYDIMVVSNGGYKPTFRVPHLVINNWNGWEIAGIQRGKETYKEFIHLMDTTLIKDISLFDKLFAIKGNVVLTKGNFHYMGKFVTEELPNLPRVHDKATAIMLETTWLDGFKYTEFQPDLPVASLDWEEIHGMRRMRLENKFIVKWKGTAQVSAEQYAELMQQLKDKKML